jgi:hypothetical protein
MVNALTMDSWWEGLVLRVTPAGVWVLFPGGQLRQGVCTILVSCSYCACLVFLLHMHTQMGGGHMAWGWTGGRMRVCGRDYIVGSVGIVCSVEIVCSVGQSRGRRELQELAYWMKSAWLAACLIIMASHHADHSPESNGTSRQPQHDTHERD